MLLFVENEYERERDSRLSYPLFIYRHGMRWNGTVSINIENKYVSNTY